MSGIFPGKKSVRKFELGGAVADPMLGVGIQYQQRAADIPNVDAYAFALEEKRKSDALLEAERQKRLLNKQAVYEHVQKMPGTAGQKKAYTEALMSDIDNYNKRSNDDVGYVFSDEGIDTNSELIDRIFNPARLEQLKNNYSLLQTGYDSLLKNNTLDSYQINDGQALVRDRETGETTQVSIDALNDQSVRDKYELLTGKQRYQQLFDAPEFSQEDSFYTGMENSSQAKANLLSSFQGASGSVSFGNGIKSYQDNKQALDAAKAQALGSMTKETKSGLQDEYLRMAKGVYSKDGFDAYVNSILDQEIAKRRQRGSDTDLVAASKLKGASEEDIREGIPTYQELYNFTRTANDSEWGVDTDVEYQVMGESTIGIDPEKAVGDLVISGDAYSMGGESGSLFGTSDSNFTAEELNGSYGSSRKLNMTLKNAKHLRNEVNPLTTGNIIDPKTGQYGKESIKSGLMILKGEDFKYGEGTFLKESPIELFTVTIGEGDNVIQKEVRVIKRSDGKLVEVKPTGMKVYQYVDDDTEQTVLLPMLPSESFKAFNTDISMMVPREDFFSNKGKLGQTGQDLLKKLRSINPSMYQYYSNELLKADAEGPSLGTKTTLNDLLSRIKKEIRSGEIRAHQARKKLEFTPRNEYDNVR